ncbi:MAG: acyl-CoA thioesterase [Myxococcota bacterium]
MKIPADATVYDGVVPFHDCDPLEIVWHGHYYKYLEIGRTKLLQGYQLDVPDFKELGYRLVVIETRCRYAFPLRYGEAFQVKAWMIDWEQRLHIGYEIRNLTHERRSAKAWTTLVTTDGQGNMLLETPYEIRRRIES